MDKCLKRKGIRNEVDEAGVSSFYSLFYFTTKYGIISFNVF